MRRGCLRAEVLMRYRESRHAVFIGSQQVQFTMRGGVARIPHEARGEHGIQCFRGALRHREFVKTDTARLTAVLHQMQQFIKKMSTPASVTTRSPISAPTWQVSRLSCAI